MLTNVDPLIPAAERESIANGVTCFKHIKGTNLQLHDLSTLLINNKASKISKEKWI